uniref:Secreted protein n=1 Tax=Ixodes scapularis TaxID=6945 RepID=A0A4D5REU2_IXOSC
MWLLICLHLPACIAFVTCYSQFYATIFQNPFCCCGRYCVFWKGPVATSFLSTFSCSLIFNPVATNRECHSCRP